MSHPWRAGLCVVIVALDLSRALGAVVPQRTEPLPLELAWIGLFNRELLNWLENENRLDELCVGPEGSPEVHACRAAHMEPKVAVIPVRAAPRVDGTRLGEIVL